MLRSKWFVALQLAFAAAVVWYASQTIVDQWNRVRRVGFGFEPRWSFIALSVVIVFVTYGLLIEVWRFVVKSWGASLSRSDAARIWFVSNLGRYVPGKVWAIGAMGVMAERAGVPAFAAAGSSIIVNLVNLVAGAGVVAALGAGQVSQSRVFEGGQGRSVTVIGVLILLVLVLVAPRVMPLLLRLAERLTGRSIALPPIPVRAIWLTAIASVTAWLLYGFAFYLFAKGITPDASGPVSGYVLAFTASYLIGYVIIAVPGGLGVRETALVKMLAELSLATNGAGLIAVASRLWLTATEVLPGVVYLVVGTRRRAAPPNRTGNV